MCIGKLEEKSGVLNYLVDVKFQSRMFVVLHIITFVLSCCHFIVRIGTQSVEITKEYLAAHVRFGQLCPGLVSAWAKKQRKSIKRDTRSSAVLSKQIDDLVKASTRDENGHSDIGKALGPYLAILGKINRYGTRTTLLSSLT